MNRPGRNTPKSFAEDCRCANVWALKSFRRSGVDKPEDDHVARYREWRDECPDKSKVSHAAFCEQCDNSYPASTGGADWLRKQGWKEINPFEKFPEPLRPRPALADKVPPEMLKEGGLSCIEGSNLFAEQTAKSKIEELPAQELSVLENHNMNDYIRDILRMSGGGGLGGRERLALPDELMDALAGDSAQEAIMKERVLECGANLPLRTPVVGLSISIQ